MKRFLAGLLALTTVMSMNAVAFAAEETETETSTSTEESTELVEESFTSFTATSGAANGGESREAAPSTADAPDIEQDKAHGTQDITATFDGKTGVIAGNVSVKSTVAGSTRAELVEMWGESVVEMIEAGDFAIVRSKITAPTGATKLELVTVNESYAVAYPASSDFPNNTKTANYTRANKFADGVLFLDTLVKVDGTAPLRMTFTWKDDDDKTVDTVEEVVLTNNVKWKTETFETVISAAADTTDEQGEHKAKDKSSVGLSFDPKTSTISGVVNKAFNLPADTDVAALFDFKDNDPHAIAGDYVKTGVVSFFTYGLKAKNVADVEALTAGAKSMRLTIENESMKKIYVQNCDKYEDTGRLRSVTGPKSLTAWVGYLKTGVEFAFPVAQQQDGNTIKVTIEFLGGELAEDLLAEGSSNKPRVEAAKDFKVISSTSFTINNETKTVPDSIDGAVLATRPDGLIHGTTSNFPYATTYKAAGAELKDGVITVQDHVLAAPAGQAAAAKVNGSTVTDIAFYGVEIKLDEVPADTKFIRIRNLGDKGDEDVTVAYDTVTGLSDGQGHLITYVPFAKQDATSKKWSTLVPEKPYEIRVDFLADQKTYAARSVETDSTVNELGYLTFTLNVAEEKLTDADVEKIAVAEMSTVKSDYATFDANTQTVTVNSDKVSKAAADANMKYSVDFTKADAESVRVATTFAGLKDAEAKALTDGKFSYDITIADKKDGKWTAPADSAEYPLYFVWLMEDGTEVYSKTIVVRKTTVPTAADDKIDSVLEDLANDKTSTPDQKVEKIDKVVTSTDLTKADPNKVEELGDVLKTVANVTVAALPTTVAPAPDADADTSIGEIDIKGAALNALSVKDKVDSIANAQVKVEVKPVAVDKGVPSAKIANSLSQVSLKTVEGMEPVNIDIDMAVTVGEKELPVTTLAAPLTIRAQVPASLVKFLTETGKKLQIVHEHTGGVEVLTPSIEKVGGEYYATFKTSKLSTFAFVVAEKIESKPHTGGSSNSGSGSSSTTTPNPSVGGPAVTTPAAKALTSDAAVSATAAAVKAATGTSANVVLKNVTTVSPAAMKSVVDEAAKSGKTARVLADTVKDGKVVARLYVDANLASKLSKDINLAVTTDAAAVKSVADKFAQYFTNEVAIVKMEQKGEFGMPVQVAVKLDLSKLDAAKLSFYSYDAATNQFIKIEKPANYIDTAGYLHFTTELGNYIVVSSGALMAK